MGWWLPDPELEGQETVLWRATANRAQDGGRRHIGGVLMLTERRLLFTPGRFDAVTGGQPWWAPRGAIVAIDEVPRSAGFHLGSAAAGNRRRMRLSTAYGGQELFTVNQVRQKVAELNSLLGLPTA